MAQVNIKFDFDPSVVSNRVKKLLHKTQNLGPVWDDASAYMKSSTVNRILRTKTSPDGERWEALSEVTIELKGHDKPLFESGELSRSINISDVDDKGFQITAGADYASYMQGGVQTLRGAFRSKRPAPQVPARPFMGFSEENKRRIAKLLHDYLKDI